MIVLVSMKLQPSQIKERVAELKNLVRKASEEFKKQDLQLFTSPDIIPNTKISYTYENFYLYGAVEPITGESFLLQMPYLNSGCFQIFLNELAMVYSSSLNILVLDNGQFNQARTLQIPYNVALLFLPLYSPN